MSHLTNVQTPVLEAQMLGLNEARCPAVCEGFVPHREKPRSLDNRSLKHRRAGWFLKNMKHSTYETSFVSGDHWIMIPFLAISMVENRFETNRTMVQWGKATAGHISLLPGWEPSPLKWLSQIPWHLKPKLLAGDTSAWMDMAFQTSLH